MLKCPTKNVPPIQILFESLRCKIRRALFYWNDPHVPFSKYDTIFSAGPRSNMQTKFNVAKEFNKSVQAAEFLTHFVNLDLDPGRGWCSLYPCVFILQERWIYYLVDTRGGEMAEMVRERGRANIKMTTLSFFVFLSNSWKRRQWITCELTTMSLSKPCL